MSGLQAAINRVFETTSEPALRYGGIFGFEDLRQVLADRQGRIQGVQLGVENFLVTHGSSGGIDAVCDTFLNPGDVCIVERPNFAGSLRTIRGHLCEIVEADLGDDDGYADRVEEALQRLEAEGVRAKLLYTVPDHHNPTGANMSLAVREKLVEVCARHRVFLLEDMAYHGALLRRTAAALAVRHRRRARRHPGGQLQQGRCDGPARRLDPGAAAGDRVRGPRPVRHGRQPAAAPRPVPLRRQR